MIPLPFPILYALPAFTARGQHAIRLPALLPRLEGGLYGRQRTMFVDILFFKYKRPNFVCVHEMWLKSFLFFCILFHNLLQSRVKNGESITGSLMWVGISWEWKLERRAEKRKQCKEQLKAWNKMKHNSVLQKLDRPLNLTAFRSMREFLSTC